MMDPHRCEWCGKPNNSDWSFCAHCGKQTVRVLQEQTNAEEDGAQGGISAAPSYTLAGDEEIRRPFNEECSSLLPDGGERLSENHLEAADMFSDKEIWSPDIGDECRVHTTKRAMPAIHVIDETFDVNEYNIDSSSDEITLMDGTTMQYVMDAINRKMGYRNIMSGLHCEERNEMKSVSINIALTGQSGCGKSTLINTLRGLKCDDKGAAPIGFDETTTQPTQYVHPKNSQLSFWDLPGVGTELFPKETYLNKVQFKKYDFIILLSDTRFTELDGWLAKAINYRFPRAKLFFVRTKVDSDLFSINSSRRKPMSKQEQEKVLTDIKTFSIKQLKRAEITDLHIFLINSNDPQSLDFGKLVNMLIMTVSEIKREALVLTNIILTADALKAKVAYLNEQIKTVSAAAAAVAVMSNRYEKQYLEIDELRSEALGYQRQLGIDTETVECIALAFNLDSSTFIAELNSESEQILSNFTEFYDKHDTVAYSVWFSLPFIGKRLQIWAYQRQCSTIMKKLLNTCINDAFKLRKSIIKYCSDI